LARICIGGNGEADVSGLLVSGWRFLAKAKAILWVAIAFRGRDLKKLDKLSHFLKYFIEGKTVPPTFVCVFKATNNVTIELRRFSRRTDCLVATAAKP
jgi:hypothetical protein